METKIIIRQFNILNARNEVRQLEQELDEWKKQGYRITNTNMTTGNDVKYTIYIILEK